MKFVRSALICGAVAAILSLSCQKNDEAPAIPPNTSTEDAIAAYLAAACGDSMSTCGLMAQVKNAVLLGKDELLPAETQIHDTVRWRSQSGTSSYDFEAIRTYILSQRRDIIDVNYELITGSYSTDKIFGTQNFTDTFEVSHLNTAEVTVRGFYNRLIDDTLKILDQRIMSGSLSSDSLNFIVSKSDREVFRGTAGFTVSIDSSDGSSNDYNVIVTVLTPPQIRAVVAGRTYLLNYRTSTATYVNPNP